MQNPFKQLKIKVITRSTSPIVTFNSERAEIVGKFLDRLNGERLNTKYKPLTAKIVAIKLGHLKSIQDLHYFFNLCDRSKSFGSKFFYELKVQK